MCRDLFFFISFQKPNEWFYVFFLPLRFKHVLRCWNRSEQVTSLNLVKLSLFCFVFGLLFCFVYFLFFSWSFDDDDDRCCCGFEIIIKIHPVKRKEKKEKWLKENRVVECGAASITFHNHLETSITVTWWLGLTQTKRMRPETRWLYTREEIELGENTAQSLSDVTTEIEGRKRRQWWFKAEKEKWRNLYLNGERKKK